MSPSHTNEGDRGYVALPSANETPAFRGVSVKGEIYTYMKVGQMFVSKSAPESEK